MFPIDYQVNVRRGDGPVQRYTLLENQDDRHLIVLHPSLVREMMALMRSGNALDDSLVALLADEAVVLDRKNGQVLPLSEANEVLHNSEHPALRRAAIFRTPLPSWSLTITGEDLAWAFSLEAAKRRLSV